MDENERKNNFSLTRAESKSDLEPRAPWKLDTLEPRLVEHDNARKTLSDIAKWGNDQARKAAQECGLNPQEQSAVGIKPTNYVDPCATRCMVTVTQLLALAQYALAAAHQLEHNRIDPKASDILGEWTQANNYLAKFTKEYGMSVAAHVTRRAFGMLLAPQLAKDAATAECFALLQGSETVKDQLADGRWEDAADVISRTVVAAYHQALEFHGRQR